MLLLTAACAVTITQVLRAAFGGAGLYAAGVLLVVQVAGSGALFPSQTLGTMFGWLHPVLPMSYSADAIRRTIAGGPLTPYLWADVAVLVVVTAAGVGMLIATVHWRRHVRTSEFEPIVAG